MLKLPHWLIKPESNQGTVIATHNGWTIKETGEVLVSANGLAGAIESLRLYLDGLEAVNEVAGPVAETQTDPAPETVTEEPAEEQPTEDDSDDESSEDDESDDEPENEDTDTADTAPKATKPKRRGRPKKS